MPKKRHAYYGTTLVFIACIGNLNIKSVTPVEINVSLPEKENRFTYLQASDSKYLFYKKIFAAATNEEASCEGNHEQLPRRQLQTRTKRRNSAFGKGKHNLVTFRLTIRSML